MTVVWGLVGAAHESSRFVVAPLLAAGAVLHLLRMRVGRLILVFGSLLACISGVVYAAWYLWLPVASYLGWMESAVPRGDVSEAVNSLAFPLGLLLMGLSLPAVTIMVFRRLGPPKAHG